MIVNGSIQSAGLTTAQIAASTAIPLVREIVYNTQNGTYAIGDGVTILPNLTFYGGISASGLTVGTTTITGGTSTRVLYNNAGVVGEYAISGTGSVLMTSTIGSTVQGYSASTTLLGNSTTGSGSNIVLGTSPTFVTDITTPLIIGGTGVTSKISYKASTANATTTATAYEFTCGNNGATTAFSITHDGKIGFGATPGPTYFYRFGASIQMAATTHSLLCNFIADTTNVHNIIYRLTSSTWIGSAGNIQVTDTNNKVFTNGALATNATNGFVYLPTCAGTPTGVPTAYTGGAAVVIDSTNNKMYIYSGGAWVALN